MKLPKNLELFTFIILILISLVLIVYPIIREPIGVIVISVGTNSPCRDIITVGSTITGVRTVVIKNSDDFTKNTVNLEGIVTFIVNDNPRSCNIPKGLGLNVSVTDMKKEGIKFGIDVWGGTYYLFESREFSQDLIDTINSRATKYGLVNTKIEPLNNSLIKITTSSDEENYVNFLVEQGKLNGKVTQTIDSTEFLFNDKTYEIVLKDEYVILNGSKQEIGQHFKLDDVDLVVENISGNTTTISAFIFYDTDLTILQGTNLGSRIAKQDNNYLFVVPVGLSENASKTFGKTTKNLEVLVNPVTGEGYSKYPLDIFIDDTLFINVPILSSDLGTKPDNLILWGGAFSMEEATKNMITLKIIIETKSLPQELILIRRESFESSSGEVLITYGLLTILIMTIATFAIFFIKFHKTGLASLPLILLVLSEIIMILGVVSTQWFALILFFAGFILVFSKKMVYDWKCWTGILLYFVLIVGSTMNKWVLNIPMIIGMMATVIVGCIEGIYIGLRMLKKGETASTDYKNVMTKLWLFSTISSVALLILYFTVDMLMGFFMTFSLGMWLNLSIMAPIYVSITKKYAK